ncbi:MAG: sigma-54 dependent transcriptional regulator [candidate division KSB1 bacterium]|nr:sigma-54 dependent transcriptional regulator [candidate division KSB1 bacterium]
MTATRVFNILVVEDNVHFGKFLQDKLAADYRLDLVDNAEAAIQKIQTVNYEVVLLDLGLPRRPGAPTEIIGFEVLKRIKMHDPTVEVIVLTATSRETDSAVRAIKEGAFDFLIKDDFEIFVEKLQATMHNALEKRALARENRAHEKRAKHFADIQKRVHRYLHPDLNYHFGILLGESQAMHEVYTIIEKLSVRNREGTVLIYGESGTGKELAALSIHDKSPRGDRPWIVANIASLTPTLVESELFGIKAKTATGVDEKPGYFEQADGSSIFLDEIGEIPPEVQVKLLRVLQEREIQRVGSTKPTSVDVRVIAATNKNLKELVEKEKFRNDLFFRLDEISITMPPLRERREDIPLFIQHNLYSIQREENNPNLKLAADAIDFLQDCDWPGNVRELQNVMKKAAFLRNHDTLTAADFRKLLAGNGRKIFSPSGIDGRLPTIQELISAGETRSFKNIHDEKVRYKVLLRTLIEREGLMEEVLKELDIARNTGYKFIDEAQTLLLTGLCHVHADVDRLANMWGVGTRKLEKTIRRAHRLADHWEALQKRFMHDQNRLAVFLNVNAEQLQKVGEYLSKL